MKDIEPSAENVQRSLNLFKTIKQDYVYSIPKFSLQQHDSTHAFNYASPNSCDEALHVLRPQRR